MASNWTNKGLIALLATFLIEVASAAPANVFLVQNSGWMEPFYTDPHSEFKPLAQAVIRTYANADADIVVLAFNQAAPGNPSPNLLYRGRNTSAAAGAVAGIDLAHKSGSAYADTDFGEAVISVVRDQLKGSPAILWILTNNKNSPHNSPDTARRNREFYELVHREPAIVRTLAFPLAMAVKGPHYQANGLMLYALAYGKEAGDALERLVEGGVAGKLLTEPPARLKPLDRESLLFVPRAVKNTQAVTARLAPDKRTVILGVDVSTRPSMVEITGALKNAFYPYEIEHAAVSAKLVGRGWESGIQVSAQNIEHLAPDAEVPVTVQLTIPALPGIWSSAALAQMGTAHRLDGALRVSLTDQELEIADTFRAKLDRIFPGDPLPDIFRPDPRTTASTAEIPIVIVVRYPVYPLVVIGIGVLGCLAAVIWLLSLYRGGSGYMVSVDGQTRKVAVRPFSKSPLSSSSGEPVAMLQRGFGKPKVVWAKDGSDIRIL